MYKLFIISPHFPPSALPPSQRIRLMVKHTKNMGFETTVFTTFPKYREEKNDDWLIQLAGKDFNLITLKSLSQHITRKFKIGDLGLRFIPFLFFRLLKECRNQKPDFIIYPVPPWYLLTIAPIIKKITGVKYAIDFIDPWVSPISKEKKSLKKKISQFIAKKLEGWVTKNASYIYAVSEQINLDLKERHPELNKKTFKAVPYGVEISDFSTYRKSSSSNNQIQFNYIGAVWSPAYPVVSQILKAFKKINETYVINVDFIGTSYAGKGLTQPSLEKFIKDYALEKIVHENPDRVTYQEAVKLTLNADILFLFGDMSKQYAASKLMGLVASQQPFFAFLHKDSFPYQFLKSFNYKYLVGYSNEKGDLPENNFNNLVDKINTLILNLNQFEPIPLNDPNFLAHTAEGMTKNILTPIKEIIENDQSH